MAKKERPIQNTVSFGKAQEMLSKFRYKPRREWTKNDRLTFKICNFAVLSKKRLNKVFAAFDSIGKLSDKSHYKYSELDILILKELILENLNVCFQRFNLDIKIIKEDLPLYLFCSSRINYRVLYYTSFSIILRRKI